MEVNEERKYCVYMHTSPSGKKYIGITSQSILACCNHRPHRKTAGGFHWKFYDEYINEKEGLLCVS